MSFTVLTLEQGADSTSHKSLNLKSDDRRSAIIQSFLSSLSGDLSAFLFVFDV